MDEFTPWSGGSDGKESACKSRDLGLIPGFGRSPGEGNGNLLQYSCLETFMDRKSLMGYCPWDSPDKNTGVGCHFSLQGIFPTQGSNPGLLICRQILYHLSYKEPIKRSQMFYSFLCFTSLIVEKKMATHSVFLPGKSHGQRSLVG